MEKLTQKEREDLLLSLGTRIEILDNRLIQAGVTPDLNKDIMENIEDQIGRLKKLVTKVRDELV